MTSDNLTTWIGWIVALGTLLGMWWKLRQDDPVTRADVALKYQQMALSSAKNEADMKVRVDELEARLDSMEARHIAEMNDIKARHAEEMRIVKVQLADAEEYISGMDNWASQVLNAFRQLGVTSLTPKPKRKSVAN